MLDILDKYKIHPKLLAILQKEGRYVDELNFDDVVMSQTPRSASRSQERHEYYNDFEDCLRDFKNAKLNLPKRNNRRDGENGESDSEYLECCEGSEIKAQSTFTSKSMTHVNTATATDNSFIDRKLCQQMVFDVKQNVPVLSTVAVSRRVDAVTTMSKDRQQEPQLTTTSRAKSNERTQSEKVKGKRHHHHRRQQQSDESEQFDKNDDATIDVPSRHQRTSTQQNTSSPCKAAASQTERSSRKSMSNENNSINNNNRAEQVKPTTARYSSGDEIKSSSSSTKRNNPPSTRSIQVENVCHTTEMSPVTAQTTLTDGAAVSSRTSSAEIGQMERQRSESRKRSCKKRQAKLTIAPSDTSCTTATSPLTSTITSVSNVSKQNQQQSQPMVPLTVEKKLR